MNERLKYKLAEKIRIIESGRFQVDDVELLLIYIRESIQAYPLLREMCDFIAHPTRNKGLIVEEMDIFYSKFKYMPTKLGEVLDYSNVPKNIYELLFIKGVDQMLDDFWMQHLGMNRTQVKSHIRLNLFSKHGSLYKSKAGKTDDIRSLLRLSVSQPPAEEQLTQKAIIDQVKQALMTICQKNGVPLSNVIIDKYQDQFMLFFFEIIQDCKFILHDGAIATGYITVSSSNNLYEKSPQIGNMHFQFDACVPIQQSFAIFPLIRSNALVRNHIPSPDDVIEWWDDKKTSGKLQRFTLSRLSRKV